MKVTVNFDQPRRFFPHDELEIDAPIHGLTREDDLVSFLTTSLNFSLEDGKFTISADVEGGIVEFWSDVLSDQDFFFDAVKSVIETNNLFI